MRQLKDAIMRLTANGVEQEGLLRRITEDREGLGLPRDVMAINGLVTDAINDLIKEGRLRVEVRAILTTQTRLIPVA